MTVVPVSSHASKATFKVSAVLSGTGARDVLPDSRSTPPNTHSLSLNRVTPVIFAPTEIALVDFDGHLRTTYLPIATLKCTIAWSLWRTGPSPRS
jgi:hypothetical protein